MLKSSEIIDKIVLTEWDMFQAVNEGGPRALCQEDRVTFEGMRRAQFIVWSAEACESYSEDLEKAAAEGRNLINEKYIHMMKYSSPLQYEKLIKMILSPDDDQRRLAQEISDKMLSQTVVLFEKYPYVSGSGRPLHSDEDFYGETSIETYQMGELLTFSVKTLSLLKEHLQKLEESGQSLAENILESTVKFYGYKNLPEAEASTKERILREGVEFSCDCEGDGCCPSCHDSIF